MIQSIKNEKQLKAIPTQMWSLQTTVMSRTAGYKHKGNKDTYLSTDQQSPNWTGLSIEEISWLLL